ncbi:MAG: hypothetical protein U0531_11845 [Dehalococcoidia bacterium]
MTVADSRRAEAEVVDTNVLVAANARDTHASPVCSRACKDALVTIQRSKRVVLDDGRRILKEYLANASSSGQPGVGDAFLLWVLRNQANRRHCEQVTITPRAGADDNFEEFPIDPDLAGFDRADRKFVAVALASNHQPAVLNATDTDWYHHREALGRYGLRITFLCPELMHAART